VNANVAFAEPTVPAGPVTIVRAACVGRRGADQLELRQTVVNVAPVRSRLHQSVHAPSGVSEESAIAAAAGPRIVLVSTRELGRRHAGQVARLPREAEASVGRRARRVDLRGDEALLRSNGVGEAVAAVPLSSGRSGHATSRSAPSP
jgi:hypothetical protein